MRQTRFASRTLLLFVVLGATGASGAAAQDQWSRLRGPNGTGVSATTV